MTAALEIALLAAAEHRRATDDVTRAALERVVHAALDHLPSGVVPAPIAVVLARHVQRLAREAA